MRERRGGRWPVGSPRLAPEVAMPRLHLEVLHDLRKISPHHEAWRVADARPYELDGHILAVFFVGHSLDQTLHDARIAAGFGDDERGDLHGSPSSTHDSGSIVQS